MRPSAAWIAAVLVFVALLAAPLAAHAATVTIEVKDFAFQPNAVTIGAGDTVTWRNADTASHTATSTATWDTGAFAPGTSRSITFETPGTYRYFCLIHSIMFGTIVVLPAGEASTSPAPAQASPGGPSPLPPSNASPSGRLVLAATEPLTAAIPRAPEEPGTSPLTVASWAIFFAGALALAWRLAR